MAMKSFILLIPILIVIFVGTQAEAQLPPTTAGASFNISGIVLCSTDSSVYNVATPTPPFPSKITTPTFYFILRPPVVVKKNNAPTMGHYPTRVIPVSMGRYCKSGVVGIMPK
ncbi:putative phylloplanin [Helianthus annuus]|nr:putative phylloplanin [Helianthus annuus]